MSTITSVSHHRHHLLIINIIGVALFQDLIPPHRPPLHRHQVGKKNTSNVNDPLSTHRKCIELDKIYTIPKITYYRKECQKQKQPCNNPNCKFSTLR